MSPNPDIASHCEGFEIKLNIIIMIIIITVGFLCSLWECIRTVLYLKGSVGQLGAAVMQQADVAALWLLEALVLTLPQSLLQAYVVVSTDVGIMSPGTPSLQPPSGSVGARLPRVTEIPFDAVVDVREGTAELKKITMLDLG